VTPLSRGLSLRAALKHAAHLGGTVRHRRRHGEYLITPPRASRPWTRNARRRDAPLAFVSWLRRLEETVNRQPRERKRFRTYLREVVPGVPPPEVPIVHEHDCSCCRRELWNQTMTELVLAVPPPVRLLAVNFRYDQDRP
jgi:hypothetical protein